MEPMLKKTNKYKTDENYTLQTKINLRMLLVLLLLLLLRLLLLLLLHLHLLHRLHPQRILKLLLRIVRQVIMSLDIRRTRKLRLHGH